MNKMQSENISSINDLLKKIKRLNRQKIYSYSVIGNIGPKERAYMSRLADRGEIVKHSRGKFFKSGKSVYKSSDKSIAINKTMFTNDLFWSVGNGAEVKVDTLITRYIELPRFKDISALYHLFGYKRVLATALKHFKSRNNERYILVRKELEKCAQWSLNDKRS
ncbi:MAG: hypothetical protein ABFR02_07100 [Campylobacterota bacterium]